MCQFQQLGAAFMITSMVNVHHSHHDTYIPSRSVIVKSLTAIFSCPRQVSNLNLIRLKALLYQLSYGVILGVPSTNGARWPPWHP
jgi:hypothetical protein